MPSRRMPSSMVLPGAISLTATCSALPFDDLLAVEFAQHVAAFEPGAAGGRVRRDLADDGAGSVRQVEEAGVVGRHVVHADAEVAVVHGAVLDDRLGRSARDLRGNGEAGAGKRAAAGDDEGVDADQFAVGVHERAAGVAGIDGRIGLDEVAGLARIVAVGIGAIERADDAARDGELEVAEGAAEGQHGFAGLQLAWSRPRRRWCRFVRVDLDDGEVVELVDADQLGREDAAVVERDADLQWRRRRRDRW